MKKSEKAFKETLVKVTDIREDFLLKWFFNLVKYTLRTNFYTKAFKKINYYHLKLIVKHKCLNPDPIVKSLYFRHIWKVFIFGLVPSHVEESGGRIERILEMRLLG